MEDPLSILASLEDSQSIEGMLTQVETGLNVHVKFTVRQLADALRNDHPECSEPDMAARWLFAVLHVNFEQAGPGLAPFLVRHFALGRDVQ